MKKGLILSLLVLMVLSAFVLSSCFTPAATTNIGTSIYEAVSGWSTDVAVNVTGVVIGYPGRAVDGKDIGGFSKKLFVEDDKGGVYVFDYDLNESYDSTPSNYKFDLGEEVTINGTLTKYYGNFELKVATVTAITKTGKTFSIIPDDLTDASTFSGELLRLVKISGTASDVSGNSFKVITSKLGAVSVYDSTYGSGLNFDSLIKDGDNVEVTGIAYLYNNAYEILPRLQSDIVKK